MSFRFSEQALTKKRLSNIGPLPNYGLALSATTWTKRGELKKSYLENSKVFRKCASEIDTLFLQTLHGQLHLRLETAFSLGWVALGPFMGPALQTGFPNAASI
jgi:hypothetical protein